jgi:hypothetical protein
MIAGEAVRVGAGPRPGTRPKPLLLLPHARARAGRGWRGVWRELGMRVGWGWGTWGRVL